MAHFKAGTDSSCFIDGYLGDDPEVAYMPSGDLVVTLSVGVTRLGSKDQNTGQRKEFTVWNKVRAFGAAAAFIANWSAKGTLVSVKDADFRINRYDLKDLPVGNNLGCEPFFVAGRIKVMHGGRTEPLQYVAHASQQLNVVKAQKPVCKEANVTSMKQNQVVDNKKVQPQEPLIDFDDDIPF